MRSGIHSIVQEFFDIENTQHSIVSVRLLVCSLTQLTHNTLFESECTSDNDQVRLSLIQAETIFLQI